MTENSNQPTKGQAPVLTITLLIVLTLGWCIFWPHNQGVHESSMRIKCASNLRQIGLAAKMYANQNPPNFPYPSDFAAILNTQEITADIFVCPRDEKSERATGPTTQAIAAQLDDPALHHCSYVWTGCGLNDSAAEDVVLAFEPPSDHDGDGLNVLFGDGHADWQDCKAGTPNEHVYEHLLADLKNGVHPLRVRP